MLRTNSLHTICRVIALWPNDLKIPDPIHGVNSEYVCKHCYGLTMKIRSYRD